MDIHTNIPLKNFTTMKLGGNAKFIAEARTNEDVALIFKKAKEDVLPVVVLGGGSNVVVSDRGFDGIVMRIRINGFEIIDNSDSSVTIRIGAGEKWDSMVERTVGMQLSGIEAMSGIPGTVGAGPVQNVGAYGQEIADTLEYIEAFDSQDAVFIKLTKNDCNFSYRDSIFKNSGKNRYVITYVVLKLSKNLPQPPFYDSLQKYFDQHSITLFTPKTIRETVLAIRNEKLPDPANLPNAGSFFKNSIIEKWKLDELRQKYPDIPAYDMGDKKYKIPSGWLIEKVGLKGQLINGIRVYDKNALVLVNESAQLTNDLILARDKIITKVNDTFHIQIQQEPIEI